MRKQFVKTVEEILDINENVVLILGDIGVFGFRNSFVKYPNRVFNIGILEQSTVGVASGLAMLNFIPIVHTISPFLVERCLEQLKIDFGYQQLKGNFISVGASYDYSSLGPTHHCPADVSILKAIPGMQIIVPGTSQEFDALFNETYSNQFPTYYRLSERENNHQIEVKFGRANIIKKGKNGIIVVVGPLLDRVISATEDMDVTILYYTTVSPFDSKTFKKFFNSTKIVIVEPYYEGVLNYEINKCTCGNPISILNIGVPHKFMTNYGRIEEHDSKNGLAVSSIKQKIKHFINE